MAAPLALDTERRLKRTPDLVMKVGAVILAVGVLAAVAVVFVLMARGIDATAVRAMGAEPLPPQLYEPTANFVGDSYTKGSDIGGFDEDGFPMLVCEKLGCRAVTDFAVGGSGYWRHEPLLHRRRPGPPDRRGTPVRSPRVAADPRAAHPRAA